MAYKKGETGNPGGRPSMKPWSEALMLAVKRSAEKGKKTKRLAVLADTCVKKGLAGDMTAIKEIGDRLDGRSVQPHKHGGEDGGPIVVEVVRFSAENKTPVE